MVLFSVFVAAAAVAAPCTLPTVTFGAMCSGSGSTSIASGKVCKPSCAVHYVPTVTSISCASGTLTPATFSCVPATENPFPWKPAQCVSNNPTGAGTPMPTASGGVWTLTGTGASDIGQVSIGPMRTEGRHTQVQLSFDYLISSTSATGQGGEGFWAEITTAVPTLTTTASPAVDAAGLIGVELDLFLDASDSDPAVPHVAVLSNNENHGDSSNTYLTNMWETVDTASNHLWSAASWKTIIVLLTPVQTSSSILTKLWWNGMLIARDTVSGQTAGVTALLGSPKRIWAGVYAENAAASGAATKQVRNFQVCGAEAPTLWSMYQRLAGSHVRNCVQVYSFGNPGSPGVWRPLGCPSGVPVLPLAPQQTPQTA